MSDLKAPSGLGTAGRKLWRDMCAAFEFDVAERAILAAACRQADDVARLDESIAADGAVVAGSRGQSRLNGAIPEVRQGRLALARLIGELRLPADDDAETLPATSAKARAAANARWSGHNSRKAAQRAVGQAASHG